MATTKKNTVVVLTTATGEPLVIRSNPTKKAVRTFVEEHARRFAAGEPGGPSGIPAYQIYAAHRFEDEFSWLDGAAPTEEIDISDLLP